MPSAGLRRLIEAIETGTQGPEIGALFDLDGTLIRGYSAQDVLVEGIKRRQISLPQIAETAGTAFGFAAGQIPFVEFVNRSAAELAGRPDHENYELGREIFAKRIAQRIYPEARALVDAHRRAGHTIAAVSSATPYQVEPVAEDFGIDHVLCTRLEVEDGLCTGKVQEPACYGEGKLVAASELAAEVGFDLESSFFYSDGLEDLPLLEAVGHPCTLNPGSRLATIARRRGWPRVHFHSRDLPGPADFMRTGLAWASTLPVAWVGVADFLLTGSLREARNLSTAVWAELTTAALDLRLEVDGAEHLWSHRPAVFVFNHQSALDVLVLAKLLRGNATGIAKRELQYQPIVGQIFQAGGVVFIDRANHDKAVAKMKSAVEALQDGISIAVAPEGTRSPTRALGPFKKGAFHLALDGQVPVVPIVIKNTTDWMPKGALFARPGVVDVVVLPPVATDRWRAETIDEHVAEVRQMFADVLEPG